MLFAYGQFTTYLYKLPTRDLSKASEIRDYALKTFPHEHIFIERLWRLLKYELIYLLDFRDGKHLKFEVKKWFNWYNDQRFYQALDYQTPNTVYWKSLKSLELV